MEKISTDWAALTITSSFKVKMLDGLPVVCSGVRGERFYTEVCGMGWRFAMLYSSYSQSIMVEFDSHFAHRGLGVLQVTVMLKSETMKDDECYKRETRPAEPEKRSPIVSWPAAEFSKHQILVFKVGLREAIDIPQPIGLSPSIRHSLGDSIRSGTFVDTRFFLYSKRSPSGRVFHPLPVYANSVLLSEKSEYMRTLLSVEGFSESTPGDIQTSFPQDGEPFTEAYDYESDSDLEDEADTDAVLAADRRMIRRNTVPTEEASLIVRQHSTSSSIGSVADKERNGRTIHIKDMAYRTWQALIFYLYTGDIAFLPLRSDPTKSREAVTDQYLADNPHDPPPCSPKSMYRLAEKLGLEELERLSFQAIRGGLSEQNILQEVFSRFTSRYPVIQEMEVDILCRDHYSAPAVSAAFAQMMQPVAEGELPHSARVLTSIFEKLAKRGRTQ